MTPFDLSIQEYADPDVILDPKKIRRKYILSWFFVDMISTIPLDYILQLIYGNVDPKGIYLTSIDLRWPQMTLGKMTTLWLQKSLGLQNDPEIDPWPGSDPGPKIDLWPQMTLDF